MAKRISAVIGHLKGETKTTVQSLIFAPKDEWTVAECKAWLKDHDFKAPAVDETGSSYRYRQRDPGDFDAGSLRTIRFKGGDKLASAWVPIRSLGVSPDAELIKALEPDEFMRVVKALGTTATGFARVGDGPFRCGHCVHFQVKKLEPGDGVCDNDAVKADEELEEEKHDASGRLVVAAGDVCHEYEPVKKEKAMKGKFEKFIPFAKVDIPRREVWGIVTAEVPDKDREVCDYEGSKPHYQAVINEMSKATDGENYFPLRYMHQLDAIGKCIAFDFRDGDREVFMGFKVVNDEKWKLVEEHVLTGFSHGGKVVNIWPDPVYEGCKRYVAKPSEISLVDNPCLPNAHFLEIKADGTAELRKFAKVVPASEVTPEGAAETNRMIKTLQNELALLKAQVFGKVKTKRVAGEDLPASAFLIVLDADKTATWNLPIKFSNEAKSKRHIRNALARFNQLKGVPQEAKDKAWKKLVAAAKDHGIDVEEEKKKLATIQNYLRKATRIRVNKLTKTAPGGNVGVTLAMLDNDLGRLSKGMYEVSRLASLIQELGYLIYNVVAEEDWEGDADSPEPAMLADNVDGLLETLLTMVEAEAEEMREDLEARTS